MGMSHERDPHAAMREELLAAEARIDKLHEEGKADLEGALLRESIEVPESWLEFVEHGEEVLGLSKEKKRRFEELSLKMFRGELNDPGEGESLEEFLKLKEQYDNLKKT